MSSQTAFTAFPPEDRIADRITEGEWDDLLWRFSQGALIPFLGAGASAYICDTQKAPPPGRELLRILASNSGIERSVFCCERHCGGRDCEAGARCAQAALCEQPRVDLARVASYSQTEISRDALNRKLVELLTGSQRSGKFSNGGPRAGFMPNPLHNLLARIAKRSPMLIITTNYDTLIEDAFDNLCVPYEVMATPNDDYDTTQSPFALSAAPAAQPVDAGVAASPRQPLAAPQPGAEAGTIWHRLGSTPADDDRMRALPEGHEPDRFRRIAPDAFSRILLTRSLIYKIHGTLRRAGPAAAWVGDFLIAEEDYVRFLGRLSHPSALVPSAILAKLKARPDRVADSDGPGGQPPRCRMLFLGYGLNDWNMRVLLDSLGVGHGAVTDAKHYLIDKHPNELQSAILGQRDFKICAMDLADFVRQLQDNCEETELISREPGS